MSLTGKQKRTEIDKIRKAKVALFQRASEAFPPRRLKALEAPFKADTPARQR